VSETVEGGLPRRWPLVGAVAAVMLVADQLTKWWVLTVLGDGRTIPVVWTLQLALHRNTGAAFSMARDSDWVRFLPLLVLVAVAVIVWRGGVTLTRPGAVAVGLVVGGALGNVVDRALRTDGGGLLSGAVVDFIDVQWWPVFNVADSGVVVGGILFALLAVVARPDEPDADADADAEGAPHDHLADADTTTT
jgi:signal peptidase II